MGAREAIAALEFEEAARDHETEAFASEVAAGLPGGDALGAAEARVDYLLERIATEVVRMERVRAAARFRIEMIEANRDDECAKLARRVAYLEGLVRQHMPGDAARFKHVYGKKSQRLAHGIVGWRQKQATVEITDAARALAFAKKHGLEIKTTETINKTPLMEWVERARLNPVPETDGFRVVPAVDEFYITPDQEF